MPRYYSSAASTRDRVAPRDLPFPIGVLPAPDDHMPVGIAYQSDMVGGWLDGDWIGPVEAVWRLVVGGAEVEGRFVLRRGEFVELGDAAY